MGFFAAYEDDDVRQMHASLYLHLPPATGHRAATRLHLGLVLFICTLVLPLSVLIRERCMTLREAWERHSVIVVRHGNSVTQDLEDWAGNEVNGTKYVVRRHK